MARILGILFDKDGTLFDFTATWGEWARALLIELAAGDPVEVQRLAAAIGYVMPHADQPGHFEPHSPVIAGTAEFIAEHLLPHLTGWEAERLIRWMNLRAEDVPLAEAVPLRPLFMGLRAGGLRLGLATNDSEVPARKHLAQAGVADLFDFVAGYDSGHGAKPEPGQLLAFAKAMGLAPETVAMVGDSCHDLAAGRAAGMVVLGVLTGPARAEVLAPLADAILPDIGAIPAWLAARGD